MTQPALPYTYPADRIKPTRWLILVYIQEFFASHHRYPKAREVAAAFGIPSQHVYAFLRPSPSITYVRKRAGAERRHETA